MPESAGSIQSSSTRSGRALGDAQQRFLAVGRLLHPEALLLQVVAQQRQQRRLVLDHEDGAAWRRRGSPLAARIAAASTGLSSCGRTTA